MGHVYVGVKVRGRASDFCGYGASPMTNTASLDRDVIPAALDR